MCPLSRIMVYGTIGGSGTSTISKILGQVAMSFRALWDIILGPAFIIDNVGCVSWLQCC